MIERYIKLPEAGKETFFLWGPRQTGKSTLLKACYPDAVWIDLLHAETFRRYLEHPESLRQEIAAMRARPFVVIDEVQKLPSILDEVHWLHENAGVRFALCGSSARKLRRGGVNLLGGRALRYELSGLISAEIPIETSLLKLVNHGYLPPVYRSRQPKRLLDSYVADYLTQEIAAEGFVRRLRSFSGFLRAAAFSDGGQVSFTNIARDCGVSNQTVRDYFDILTDTLLGRWVESYRSRPKRRLSLKPKFYFTDAGVVNVLARRGRIEPGSELMGKTFENWCHHELSSYLRYSRSDEKLSFWRLSTGVEVDFIVGDMRVAIEAKAVERVPARALKGLRELKQDHPECNRRIVVCLEPRRRLLQDGIEIVPFAEFASDLFAGEII